MIRVRLTGEESVRETFARLGDAAKNVAMEKTSKVLEKFVRISAEKHTKTGALVGSVYSRKTADGYEIGNDLQRAPHAVFVHWGTRPHVIKAKNRKMLRFQPGGGPFVFAKQVNHPGTKPDKWIERAADVAPRVFARYVEEQIRKAQ